MIIGIPRSLFYYKYKTLFEAFFDILNIKYIVSDSSNKEILENGNALAPDEACINLKLFLGHVKNLENKCDLVLVPRIKCIKENEKMCTNFYLLYDLTRNLFDINIIDFNVDVDNNKTFKNAFISLGLYLGCSYNKTLFAYKTALKKQKNEKDNMLLDITNKINSNNKKILIVGHDYNLNDDLIGKPIINILKQNGYALIYPYVDDDYINDEISSSIYFSYNIDLIKAVNKYKDYVDGIILISAFPCNTDSITNELIERNISKNIPLITFIVDEINSFSGITTRLESFMDIINKEVFYEE